MNYKILAPPHRTSRAAAVFVSLALLGTAAGCTTTTISDDDDGNGSGGGGANVDPGPAGLPVLGNFQHTADSVQLDVITDPGMQLSTPRDLQFNPLNPGELWVVNRATNSISICLSPGTPDQQTLAPTGLGSNHFLVQPSSLAMGDNGFFASIHETDDQTQGLDGTPADFMGPTLWTADLAEYEGGTASHYDMLHNSPNGMGIAWQRDNVYWVFDGYHASLTMYDFQADHAAGGSDHSDGIVRRYAEGEVRWVEHVPSHMEFHPADNNLLIVADTGNNRIAVLNTATGTQGVDIFPNYDGTDQKAVNGAVLTTLVDGAAVGMMQPSGLAVHDNIIYVSDAGNSVIWAFDLQGELVDYLQTGLPAYSTLGIDLDAAGNLYFADGATNSVWRVQPAAQ